MTQDQDSTQGFIWGGFAFTFWGLIPLYWMFIQKVGAMELTMHRVFWGSLCMLVFFGFSQKFRSKTLSHMRSLEDLRTIILSTVLIGLNWGLFIYAVQSRQLIAASLGYFINPLFNIFLGRVFFKEELSGYKWIAITLVCVGVIIYSLEGLGNILITVGLFGTFGIYGSLRKASKNIEALSGLFWEMLLIAIPGLIYIFVFREGALWPTQVPDIELYLIPLAGPVTLIPLFAFNVAVKQLRYSTVGILQYLAPTFQFILGYFVFKEELSGWKIFSFALVWLALAIYTFDLLNERKQKAKLR